VALAVAKWVVPRVVLRAVVGRRPAVLMVVFARQSAVVARQSVGLPEDVRLRAPDLFLASALTLQFD
jgi:hypothetical protein